MPGLTAGRPKVYQDQPITFSYRYQKLLILSHREAGQGFPHDLMHHLPPKSAVWISACEKLLSGSLIPAGEKLAQQNAGPAPHTPKRPALTAASARLFEPAHAVPFPSFKRAPGRAGRSFTTAPERRAE